MKRYLYCFLIIIILMISSPVMAVNDFWQATDLTGSCNDCLDAICTESGTSHGITAGDIAVVVDDTWGFCVYKLTDEGTPCTEEEPWCIDVDDGCDSSDLRWELLGTLTLNRTATPTIDFRDLGCTDDDVNGYIQLNCTATGTGAEDCNWVLYVQVNGSATEMIEIDADDADIADGGSRMNMVGAAVNARLPVGDDSTDNALAKDELNAWIFDNDGDTWTLPDIDAADGAGWWACFYCSSASAVSVDPDTEDKIRDTYDDAGLESAGEKMTSSGAAGEIMCIRVTDFSSDVAHWSVTFEKGTWAPED